MKSAPLADVCCARFPASAVGALAELRCRRDIDVFPDGEHIWLRWSGDSEVLRCVLPLPQVECYVRRAGEWYRLGRRLPCAGPPEAAEAVHLDRVIVPASFNATVPPSPVFAPVPLRVVRDGHVRPASALRCSLAALGCWADSATSAQIEAVQAAHCGERVLLRGARLPPFPQSERYWGQRILTPLGHLPEPALPESALAEALGLHNQEIAVLDGDGIEVIASDVFQPLTRAGIRLAMAERAR